MTFLLVALAVLFVPPLLIMALPPEWLALIAPAGVVGLYSLEHVFTDGDLGPAGIVISAFFSMAKAISAITLIYRVIISICDFP